MSGLSSDGAELFQMAFSIKDPYIAYNSLQTSSEKNQQNGLKEMLCGVIHMVRNVTANSLGCEREGCYRYPYADFVSA
jgi:uncharacterized protein (TIGR02391 family)